MQTSYGVFLFVLKAREYNENVAYRPAPSVVLYRSCSLCPNLRNKRPWINRFHIGLSLDSKIS